MDWIVHTLKPIIDKTYPSRPGRKNTFIGGSSMGGLMSLYAVARYNRVFSRAAALSPSIWVAPRELDELIHDTRFLPGTVVYMDYGQKELRNHRHMARYFSAMAARLLQKRVLLTSRIVPAGVHSEASWEKQIPFFIHTLLYEQS